MLLEEKFSAFVLRWLTSYYCKPLREVQGSKLVDCMIFLNFGHN
jgi:hypothetical protein